METNPKAKFIEDCLQACADWGLIPTEFRQCMTWEEQVLWLTKFIKDTVLPTVNENTEAFNTLHDFVEHYFDNLDVQEEINNKLDEMVEDGTMDTIINQEIFGQINANLAVLNSEKTVFVGDSYATGENPNSDTLTPWCDVMAGLMGLSSAQYNVVAEPGSGFCRQGTAGHTFLTKLQAVISSITNKDLVKNVIVCGGYNDNTYSVNDIKSAISTFVSYCNTQFPNATVYLGCIGYRREISDSAAVTRSHIAGAVYPAYANNVSGAYSTAKYVYLNGVENILKSNPTSYMYADNAHPNQVGQNMLGRGIYQAFKTGNVVSFGSNTMTISSSVADTVSSTVTVKRCDNQLMIAITNINLTYTTGTFSLNANGGMNTIAQYAVNNFIGGTVKEYSATPCIAVIQDYSLGRHTIPGMLIFDTDGNLKLQSWHTTDAGSTQSFSNVKEIQIMRCKMTMPELYS